MENKKLELVEFAVTARKYKTLLTQKFANRKKYETPDPNEVKAYIPGTIIKIKVKEGARVKAGNTLLVLEAMKMLNKVLMPSDGVVKKIHVSEGDKVPKGQVMIEIE